MTRSTGNASERDPERQCFGRHGDDKRCKKWAEPESIMCHQHQNQAPNMEVRWRNDRNMASERKLNSRAQRILSRLERGRHDRTPVENPLLELQSLAGEARFMKDVFAARVDELDQDEWTYMDRAGVEQARRDVEMYGEAMDRFSVVLERIAKLNIDARLARIEEAQAAIVVTVLNTVLDQLDLGDYADDVREKFYHEVTRHQATLSETGIKELER